MPVPVRSRYWLCTLEGYPYPQQCPLAPASFVYCCWKQDETKLALFVLYKDARTFPCRLLKDWLPSPVPTKLQAYLDNPLQGAMSLGKIPDITYIKAHATRKRKSSKKSKALSVYAHSKNADSFVHFNVHTGCFTQLDPNYGLVPSADAPPQNLE